MASESPFIEIDCFKRVSNDVIGDTV